MRFDDFAQNIREFRRHLLVCLGWFLFFLVMSFGFTGPALRIFLVPLIGAASASTQLVFGSLVDPFLIKLNMGVVVALFCVSPIIIWQLYRFVAVGLFPHERRAALPYVFLSPIFFIAGALFVYYFIFPNSWQFFVGFSNPKDLGFDVKLLINLGDYLQLCLTMVCVFGLAFQFPLVMNLLIRLKIIEVRSLGKIRKFVIVGIFVFSAVFTPPDILSQIALAVPLIILFEIAVLSGRLVK